MTMMTRRVIKESAQFRKDYKKSKKQGKNTDLLEDVIELLASDKPLPPKYNDHDLKGNWRGYRECHITPDWLLIYTKREDGKLLLALARLGSHSDLRF